MRSASSKKIPPSTSRPTMIATGMIQARLPIPLLVEQSEREERMFEPNLYGHTGYMKKNLLGLEKL